MRTDCEPDLDAVLPASFYDRHVVDVATDLLGCYLVRMNRGAIGGRIVEVEAYGGPGDPGSHADRAPNGRAKIMFGPAGRAYVYFTYGMHHCLNAVTGAEGDASAVLIRAIEPMWGVTRMRTGAPRTLRNEKLGSGPGRICRALSVDRRFNGSDLFDGKLRIARGRDRRRIKEGMRIGLSRDDGRSWRFWLESASVSR